MSHECDDCGHEFETLSRLRLHDCPADETPANGGDTETTYAEQERGESRSPEGQIPELNGLLSTARDGDLSALPQAIAVYETRLASAHESDDTERYRSISRAYREQLITVLDEATQTEGWEFLAEFLDAYHPETADEFPHVTTILQNVTGRYLIRTRLSSDVAEIPADALAFFSSILDQLEGDGYDFINEGLHPYGWGIGHPDYSVAEDIHQHASTDIFVVNAMLEHAFYADQQSAVNLLERIANDESIQQSIQHPSGELTETRYLLDAPAGAASEFPVTMPRYWDWQDSLDYEFELADDVEQRLRHLVTEHGIDADLSSGWEIADLTL